MYIPAPLGSRHTKVAVISGLRYDLLGLDGSDNYAGTDERGAQGEESDSECDGLHDAFVVGK